jgi:hypothetical protein
MIWLTWRQLRAPLLTALGALVVVGAGLVVLGLLMRDSYDSTIAGCEALNTCDQAGQRFRDRYGPFMGVLSVGMLLLPALLGAFWGAPLITRELENGTHRLVWTQSVTRRRWLTVKLGLVMLAGLLVTAAFSLLFTWASDPFDTLVGGRFGAVPFASRNLAPVGYAVCALVLGATIGLLVKRTLPTMAILIVVLAVIQIGMGLFGRAHLMPPVQESIAMNAVAMERVHGFGMNGPPPDANGTVDPDTRVVISDYELPGGWVLTSEMDLLKANGERIPPADADQCFTGGGPDKDGACLAALGLHFDIAYHPASRYWPFQAIEVAGFVVVAMLLAGFALWRIPRGVAAA